ncbi:MAG: glycosyltransferase [Desulfobacterales bacterium]|nr:glycosyltransferase [Desulfobacterales bacterium]
MKYPLVSIVVPTFNQAKFLPVALDSVIFQDYPNIEVIICNHGSTDNTYSVIEKYVNATKNDMVEYLAYYNSEAVNDKYVRQVERRYPQDRMVKVIQSEENIGGTRSYNEGFKQASGDLCTYLVADDYFLPNALSEMVDTLEQTNSDVVYSDMFVVDNKGCILQHLRKPEYDFKACFADWFHLGVSRLYRRELHDKVGFYDPGYRNANDYDMFLRFASAGAKFVHIPKVLYCTRKHYANDPSEPASWRNNGYANLLRECTICALRAREFLKTKLEN